MPKPENVINNSFKNRPEAINRKGQPKKVLTSFKESMEKKYGKKIPQSEIREIMEYIETLPLNKLQEFVKDTNLPAACIAYGLAILKGDKTSMNRVTIVETLKNRLYGTPKQTISAEVKQEKIIVELPENDT